MTRRIATHVPHHRGPAAWNVILGPQPDAEVADQNQSADFVIIGAGFAGLAAARRLTQLVPDSRIIVVDAGRIAEGAAGRNSGFMIDLPHELTSADYAGAQIGTSAHNNTIATLPAINSPHCCPHWI